jgi:hypothetical protein
LYQLSDLKIGDKFIKNNKTYLIINLVVSHKSFSTKFPNFMCVLDLSSYKVLCFNEKEIVEFERDNVFI